MKPRDGYWYITRGNELVGPVVRRSTLSNEFDEIRIKTVGTGLETYPFGLKDKLVSWNENGFIVDRKKKSKYDLLVQVPKRRGWEVTGEYREPCPVKDYGYFYANGASPCGGVVAAAELWTREDPVAHYYDYKRVILKSTIWSEKLISRWDML